MAARLLTDLPSRTLARGALFCHVIAAEGTILAKGYEIAMIVW